MWLRGLILCIAFELTLGATIGSADESRRTMIEFRVNSKTAPHWADSLWRDPVAACADLPDALEQSHADKCVANYVMVRNDDTRPIACTVSLDLPAAPDDVVDGRLKHVEASVTVMPGKHDPVMVVMGRPQDVPTQYSVDCYQAPPTSEVTFQDMQACLTGFKVKLPPVFDYYPPESKSLSEEGNTVLQFFAESKSGKVINASIHESSGSARLDKAALKMAKRMSAAGMCENFPYRITIKWRLRDSREKAGPLFNAPRQP